MLWDSFLKKSTRILLIEDDLTVLETTALALDTNGYKAIKAYNGKDGLDYAFKKDPTLIILDVNLPDIDGWKILSTLREAPKTKAIPVIMLTTLTQLSDINRAFELGANDYLPKPLSLSKLFEKVTKYCPK